MTLIQVYKSHRSRYIFNTTTMGYSYLPNSSRLIQHTRTWSTDYISNLTKVTGTYK